MGGCEECGGTVAPDGRCWECGRAQPGFRARMETTAAGGSGAAGVSDRGLVREVNADAMAVAASGPWTVGVACDGVSMTPRSDRAALLAAEVGTSATAAGLRAGALPEDALSEGAGAAGRAVARLAPPGAGPGAIPPACTYVAAVVGPEGFWCTWIGDSRAYWLPDEGPGTLLTEDDTSADEAITAWLGAGGAGDDSAAYSPGAGRGARTGRGPDDRPGGSAGGSAGAPQPARGRPGGTAQPDAPQARIRSLRPSVPGRLLLCTTDSGGTSPTSPRCAPGSVPAATRSPTHARSWRTPSRSAAPTTSPPWSSAYRPRTPAYPRRRYAGKPIGRPCCMQVTWTPRSSTTGRSSRGRVPGRGCWRCRSR